MRVESIEVLRSFLTIIDLLSELGRLVLEERKVTAPEFSDKGIGDTSTEAMPALIEDKKAFYCHRP